MLAVGLTAVIIIMNLQNDKNIGNDNIVISTEYNNTGTLEYNKIANELNGEAPELTFNTTIREITDKSTLYALSNNIDRYFSYIKDWNTTAVNELGGNNVYSITNNVKYTIRQAVVTGNGYQNKYYTYGILTIANGDFTATEQEICMIMYVDLENNTYKLEKATKEQLSNISEITKEEDIDIPKGNYNNFEYEYINNVKQMEIYLEDFVFQTFFNTENAYNLLNEEYKLKRFGNINEFVKYVTEKQNQLRNIKIVQYNVDDDGENKIYKGTDEYGNYYHIIEKSYMEYEIILDNYTMQDYSNSSQKEKIEKSAEKFILMLNSADYTNAYNLLEPTFKATYFPTEQDFINYIKNNWFARNIIASREANEDGTCVVTIKETISTTSNKMQKQFKVNMGEDMDFTIEFNV